MLRKFLLSGALTLIVAAGVLSIAVGGASNDSEASSHRESPMILGDPLADATDLYAFVSPDNPDTTTIVANWVPLEEPADGPNFYQFGDAPNYVYGVNIDNDGDAEEDVRYEWRFHSDVQNPNTFLYNTGTITSLTDPDFNFRQTYDLYRIDVDSKDKVLLGDDLPTPPNNIGPRSTPDYDALAEAAVIDLGGGRMSFAGQRDDPFFVDLGSITDVLALRKPGSDTVSGFNTHSVVLQVPSTDLTRAECNPSDSGDSTNGECVIGIWSTTHRPAIKVFKGGDAETGPTFGDLNCDGNVTTVDGLGVLRSVASLSISQNQPCPAIGGKKLVQVSRLGNPLVNEVVIPVGDKDKFNASEPEDDGQFASYVTDPELAGLINLIYDGILTDVPTSGRTDLVTVFLTGVPTVTQPPNVVASEQLRLNVTIPPAADPNPLGIPAGDFAGFPNGRRLADDVTDIALRAVVCGYGAIYSVFDPFGPCDSATFGSSPNNTTAVSDNVDANDVPFLDEFPYLAAPHSGFDHGHGHEDIHVSILPMAMGVLGLLVGLAVAGPKAVSVVRRRIAR